MMLFVSTDQANVKGKHNPRTMGCATTLAGAGIACQPKMQTQTAESLSAAKIVQQHSQSTLQKLNFSQQCCSALTDMDNESVKKMIESITPVSHLWAERAVTPTTFCLGVSSGAGATIAIPA